MTTPDPHTLNARLAEICGKEVEDVGNVWLFVTRIDGEPHYWKWNPCDDPSQMETVKAWLRKAGYDYGSEWSKNDGHFTAHVMLRPNPGGDPPVLWKMGMHKTELLALAHAICAAIPKEKP